MLGTAMDTAASVRTLENQLRDRFESVSSSLPLETAQQIFDDLNAVAVARNMGNASLYADLVNAAMVKWGNVLSRSWQEATTPWYKQPSNLYVIAGAGALLLLLVALTRKKG